MSYKTPYYTGYEQDDESSLDEDLNESNSDEEFGHELEQYLKSGESSKKTSKKSISNEFEDEMNREIENFIELKEKECSSVFKSNENLEESDTDSEAELETGIRTKKKREHFTNDELFYDPEADERDQDWINKQRNTCKKLSSDLSTQNLKSILKKSTNTDETPKIDAKQEDTIKEKYTNAKTDAILNCPCCMTMLCMDCQRHEKYKTQFRAMFVFNCCVLQDDELKYPIKKNKNISKYKRKKLDDEMDVDTDQAVKEKIEEIEIYKSVVCDICKTEVGVFDPKDEIYHFFNVLTSHS